MGYFSSDGFKSHSYPFTGQSYGPPLTEGDVLGVGYRPRTGTVFFTRNGKKLEDAFVGLNKHNLFPTVGADGSCTVHVNLGQAGFVFIEANVKKWGLAPMVGSLAPPPAYNNEQGSILLESARHHNSRSTVTILPPPPPMSDPDNVAAGSISVTRPTITTAAAASHRHRSRRSDPPVASSSSSNNRGSSTPVASTSSAASTSTSAALAATALASQPVKPSPLRHSRKASNLSSSASSPSSSPISIGRSSSSSTLDGRNPPTPGPLDISLRSLHAFPQRDLDEEDEYEDAETSLASSGSGSGASDGEESAESSRLLIAPTAGPTVIEPPAYHPIDPHVR